MLKLLFLFLFLCIFECASAQTYLMPHIDFVNLRLRGTGMMNKWYLASTGERDYGSGIGFDVRHHFKKFYLQVGFTYSENFSICYFINTNVQKLYSSDDSTTYELEAEFGGASSRLLRWSIPLLIGTTLRQNRYIQLRGFVGLMPVYRISPGGLVENYPIGSPRYPYVRQYFAIGKLVNMYQPFELHALAGVGIDIWRLSIDVRRSVALTDLAHDIQFEGKTYPFSWKGDQLTISVGWRFRIDKNRPRKNKKRTSYF